VCDALAELARPHARHLVVLRDVPLDTAEPTDADRQRLPPLACRGTVYMYIGNLEPYQGIDLLLASFARLRGDGAEATLVVVGGTGRDVRHYRSRAERLGVGAATQFTGPLPVNLQPSLFEKADILVSPRVKGINTPMKIYSYLRSGKPVLATDIPAHTQVLTPEASMLAPAEPGPFAEAMQRLQEEPELRRRLGAAGRALVEREYNLAGFHREALALYEWLAATR
jgi:glycosyltransferase involved in cell wall biosynthesis